jgi:molybdopterin converting factor small subunit
MEIIYGPLRSATGSKTVAVDLEERPVAGVVEAFRAAYPSAERHLRVDGGDLRPSVRVAVDGETAGPDADRLPDAEVQLFAAMCGG